MDKVIDLARGARAALNRGAVPVVGIYAATLFLSALMLFSVQPMFAKMALPALGGTPAVWAVSMCFFQATLLAGYVYAHALNRRLDGRSAVLAHMAVLALAALALPIGLPQQIGEASSGYETFWLLGVLAIGVGLPFFAVSATAPLLQAWFSRTAHDGADDPYFLYGASNLGSLLALVLYPVALEPLLGLGAQSMLWSFGFVALASCIALCGAIAVKMPRVPALQTNAEGTATREPLSWTQRTRWMALAAIPSGLMVAVTTYISTDVGSAPFVWVVPLALFLLTFVLVFKERLAFPYGLAVNGLPIAILLHLVTQSQVASVGFALVAYLAAALVCHRELYLARPGAGRLTDFYICMSTGGVIGGVFAALIAPQIFTDVTEFKILLLLSLIARPGVVNGELVRSQLICIVLFAVALAAACFGFKALVWWQIIAGGGLALVALIGFVLAALSMTRKWPQHRLLVIVAMIVGIAVVPTDGHTLFVKRSFFGTTRVLATEDGQFNLMLHGTTIHGAQRVRSPDGAAVTTPVPATYYAAEGPMARGVEVARAIAAKRGTDLSAGVVGLGTGSLACYAKAHEVWRYYEIDPIVVAAARDPKLFTFLSTCLPDADIVMGDARLTLKKEPAGKLDYLVIDAFSSDAIPVHLLTREAIGMYIDKLAPDGIVAMHISNRFLDLKGAVSATALSVAGLKGLYVSSVPKAEYPDAAASNVVFLTKSQASLENLTAAWPEAEALAADGMAPWSDDYSDVLTTFVAGIKGKIGVR